MRKLKLLIGLTAHIFLCIGAALLISFLLLKTVDGKITYWAVFSILSYASFLDGIKESIKDPAVQEQKGYFYFLIITGLVYAYALAYLVYKFNI
jgi:hypothetical protein